MRSRIRFFAAYACVPVLFPVDNPFRPKCMARGNGDVLGLYGVSFAALGAADYQVIAAILDAGRLDAVFFRRPAHSC